MLLNTARRGVKHFDAISPQRRRERANPGDHAGWACSLPRTPESSPKSARAKTLQIPAEIARPRSPRCRALLSSRPLASWWDHESGSPRAPLHEQLSAGPRNALCGSTRRYRYVSLERPSPDLIVGPQSTGIPTRWLTGRDYSCPLAGSLDQWLSDHTASSFAAGPLKWKRRPPGKAKISRVIVPPASTTRWRTSSSLAA